MDTIKALQEKYGLLQTVLFLTLCLIGYDNIPKLNQSTVTAESLKIGNRET